jgi:uncharacterized membrane protein YphA (DoxX/SURF4 family)
VFLWSGWGKLQNLPAITGNFIEWGIPLPHILTPFVAGLEFVGGILLIVGLLTRIAAGGLGVVMIVAIATALWPQVDSLETLLGFYETTALAVFLWLAIAGPGPLSPFAGKGYLGDNESAAGKPGAACRPVWLTPSNPSPYSNGNDPKGRARMPVGLMPGIAAHKVNSAAGGREGPLGEGVRAKTNGWIVSAEWSKISGWWQGAGPFVTRG